MAAVSIWIDKFKGVVLIDWDHPLAVAQRKKDGAPSNGPRTADTQAQAIEPAASVRSVQGAPEVPVKRRRRNKARE